MGCSVCKDPIDGCPYCDADYRPQFVQPVRRVVPLSETTEYKDALAECIWIFGDSQYGHSKCKALLDLIKEREQK